MDDFNSQKAKQIIDNNLYLTLATCNDKLQPWAAPLYYAYDSDYNFYFISASNSLHAQHIKLNAKVSMAIFDSHALAGTGDGVQIEGVAYPAKVMELPHIIFTYFRRRFPDEIDRWKTKQPSQFMGKNLFWFYKVVPTHIFTLDLSNTEVDIRVEVTIN